MSEPLRKPLFPPHRRRAALLASTSLVAALAAAPSVRAQQALPTNGSVASGAAAIGQSGSALTINQTSSRAVIDWSSFSIGAGNSVTFVQPGAGAAVLNRVTGATPSSIAGRLDANGQVFLVNPNGIAITKSGTVNVGGGFAASTLAITNRDFNEGRLNFHGGGASASVSNAGTITAAPGGFVSLLGGSVSNSGVIDAPLGKVALGSGEQATLDLTGDGFLQVALPTDAKTADGKALVDVSGTVKAAGGTVAIKAATAANAVRNAINLSGYVSARSARQVGGSIVLGGGEGGDVKVSGKLDASGRKGGGSIAVTGRNVALAHAQLIARSDAGVGGAVTATGTGAVQLKHAKIDVSGATGGGSIAVGGSPRGVGPLVNAATTSITQSALIADAVTSGNGGAITVWSSGSTTVTGRLSARGGALSGDGGAVETSGETAQLNGAHVDTSAPHGAVGMWTIDPTDFTIAASGGDITGAALSGELATTNVTILSSQGASGVNGDVIVNDPVSWASANMLTLDAARNIQVNADITVQGAGGLTLIYGDTAQTGAGSTAGSLLFALTDGGSTASASFTGAGGALTVNGVAYTLLRTEADLAQLTATPAGNFALAQDITLAQTYATDVVPDFYGRLEGLGHTLSNLTVTQGGAATNVGFFGILDATGSGTPAAPPAGAVGTVSNLFLANVNVNGGGATGVGALAGENYGQINNSGSSGAVAGTASSVGGLVGTNAGLINLGYSSVAVNGSTATGSGFGGLVGTNSGGVVGGLASGNVQGDDSVGGLVGLNTGYVNAGSAGFIVGNTNTGGVVGQNGPTGAEVFFQGADVGPGGTVVGSFGFGGVFGTTTAGGVVGLNNGRVDSSYFNGPVGGDTNIGGLVGVNNNVIVGSYAIGAVTGSGVATNIGGLVGENLGSIDSSFAMGAVSGTTDVGGLVGLEGGPAATTSVTDSYSTGVVSGAAGVGGLIGALGGGDDTVTNAYWDTTTSGEATSAGGAGHTTAELQGGAALALGANFSGGAAGGETNVYPYLNGLFPDGVHAVSGFAFKTGGAALASGAAGAATVYGDTEGSVKQPGTTGVNGYYYLFFGPAALPAGADLVTYTVANAATGATNAATYLIATGANNQTGVTIAASTLTETTALPTYSQLVTATTNATAGDDQSAGALGGVSFINITSTGADFRVDQAISTTADLSITGATTLAANVTATGGVNFNSPVMLATTVTVDSGAAGTFFAGGIDGTAVPGAGLTVNGPVSLGGNVTTSDGALVFNGPVIVNANLTIGSGTASTTFGSTIDSGSDSISSQYSLTATAGAFTFGGAIGGNFSMGAVSLTSAAAMTLPSITGVSVFAQTTAAGASLTLAPGTVLTASGAGTAVTLAAAGAFVNDAGAGAIVLTGDPPNWLIYSNNPTDDTFGGLDSGNFAIWNTPFPSATPPTGGNYYLFAFQPTVTFTSINDAKTYGQDVTARVATDFAVTGLQPGVAGAYLADTAARAYSGAPGVTSAGSPAAAGVAGGPYAISVAQGSLAALNGYALALASPGVLSVAPEAITVTAAPNTRNYDATTAAAAAPTVTTGALYDAATLTETYATPNAGAGLTLTPQIAFASPAAAGNYLVTLASSPTGTINPEPITITATPNTKVFDGNTSAAALPLLTAGTLFDPANLSETYANPGPGNAIALNPAIRFTDPAAANNYQVTLVPTGLTPPDTGVILSLPLIPVNLSPSVFVNRRPAIEMPGVSSCGVDLQLPDASAFSDPAAAIAAVSAATSQYVERCRDASQEDIANALDHYADALDVIIQKLPPKLRAQLRQIPSLVRSAAIRARAAPTRAAAVRVLQQTVAQVRREILLVRAEDPDSARIRSAVSTGVSGVLNTAAVALARAEGI
jgi:filamentous hemagglutinin family protein